METKTAVPNIKRGEYLVIRVDGREDLHEATPTIHEIEKIIGCQYLDSVTLDPKRQIVMMVDDTGMVDGKPVNSKATTLYHTRCKPGTVFAIHGDVVIVNDEDFA